MNEQKQEIISTRTGCIGGSDARTVQSISEHGSVPKSALKRLAICKGLAQQPQFTNPAIEFGNFVEEQVFFSLKNQDSRWQSNPCLVSKKYSRKNVKCIDHIDFYLQDDDNKVLTLVECKATRSTYTQTYDEYKWQIYHHWLLGSEKAKELGGYKLKVMLCHYSSEGVDLSQPFEFDPKRLEVKQLRSLERLSKSYRLDEGMDIISDYLDGMTEYYEEEIQGDLLPEKVRNEFDTITTFLAEIKERETKIDDFKRRLCNFMQERGIKSIKTGDWNITFVDESESVSFDAKAFLLDLSSKHPRKARKLIEMFEKRIVRNPYVTIKLKK